MAGSCRFLCGVLFRRPSVCCYFTLSGAQMTDPARTFFRGPRQGPFPPCKCSAAPAGRRALLYFSCLCRCALRRERAHREQAVSGAPSSSVLRRCRCRKRCGASGRSSSSARRCALRSLPGIPGQSPWRRQRSTRLRGRQRQRAPDRPAAAGLNLLNPCRYLRAVRNLRVRSGRYGAEIIPNLPSTRRAGSPERLSRKKVPPSPGRRTCALRSSLFT